MSIELVIDSTDKEINLALLKDKKLIELHKEKPNNNFNVGDIYLGKIRKVVPGLNAAFVNVGYEKDAFLHYLDLGPQFANLSKFTGSAISGQTTHADISNFKIEPDINKHGKINQVISANQYVLVQIAKEPISSKGPRLSSELTLAGRNIVLVPFTNKISVSQKIKDPKERDRLKRLIMSIKPKNFGVIIRTVAENKRVAELDADLSDLMQKWETMFKALSRANGYKKVLGEINRTSAILRDILSSEFNAIHIGGQTLFQEIRSYVNIIAPDNEKIVRLYNGRSNIFEHYGIHKQIKSAFGKVVTMSSGAYLIVEHTEALHVVDVNSGNRKSAGKTQEENAIDINMEAAEEIGRQLRLRDMGGIIVVDFIDMTISSNRKKLYEHLKACLRDDRAKHNLIPVSKFGLVEITRQRVRPETDIKTAEVCPVCKGTGEVQATILLFDEVNNNLAYLMNEGKEKNIVINMHPFVAAYFKQKKMQWKWLRQYRKWIPIMGITAYHLMEYKFLNKQNEEIERK